MVNYAVGVAVRPFGVVPGYCELRCLDDRATNWSGVADKVKIGLAVIKMALVGLALQHYSNIAL